MSVKKTELAFVCLYVLLIAIYFGSRVSFLPILLISVFVVFQFSVLFNILKLEKKTKKALFLFLAISFLAVSFFSYPYKEQSYDGLNLYLRTTLTLKDKITDIIYLQAPLYPFLAELTLALIWRGTSEHFVGLFFGIAFITALVSVWKIYDHLGLTHNVKVLSLTILATCPIVLELSTVQFKVEVFLLAASTLGYLSFIYISKYRKLKYYIALGLSTAAALLIKILFAPFAVLLLIFATFETIKAPSLRQGGVFKLTVMLGTFTLPLILWITVYGIRTPYALIIISPILFNKALNIDNDDLKIDTKLQQQCISSAVQNDKNDFLPNTSVKDLALQPVNVLTNNVRPASPFNTFMANPGVIMYASILLFPLLPVFTKFNKAGRYFYLLTLAGLALFFVFVRTIYWYLLVLFPFAAIVLPLIIEKYVINKKLKSGVNFSIYIISGFYVILLAMLIATYSFDNKGQDKQPAPVHNLTHTEILQVNEFLNKHSEGLIFDASEHKHYVFLTYLKNYHERVLRGPYYFVAVQEPPGQMYYDLKRLNVKYIVVNKSKLLDPWYKDCPRQNNIILNKFLEDFTKPVLTFNNKEVVFELISN